MQDIAVTPFRPRILLDCDGVIADFVGHLCISLQMHPDDVTNFSLKHLGPERERHANTLLARAGTALEIPPYPGASEFISRLREIGDVYCVTAPANSLTWAQERTEWLSLFGFRRSDVLHVAGESKKLIKGDILIEDNPENAVHWLNEHANGVAFILDRPWNRFGSDIWQTHERMFRVSDFDSVVEEVLCCTI